MIFYTLSSSFFAPPGRHTGPHGPVWTRRGPYSPVYHFRSFLNGCQMMFMSCLYDFMWFYTWLLSFLDIFWKPMLHIFYRILRFVWGSFCASSGPEIRLIMQFWLYNIKKTPETHYLFPYCSHNIKLWVYLTHIPERRRHLCRNWPLPTPTCHHDRGYCYCYCFCFCNPSPHTKSEFS